MAEHPALSKYAIDSLSKARGSAADEWLNRLPEILTGCEKKWNLRLEHPFKDLSFNYVACATRADSSAVVLKVCPADDFEMTTEVEALKLFAGRGMVRIFEWDIISGAMLLERLCPGSQVQDVLDDEEATSIACDTMQAFWTAAPENHQFPTIFGWASGLERLRQMFDGGTGPLPMSLVDRCERMFAELLASQSEQVLLHGDLHHGNILSSSRGWLAIDPKGLVGEREYEVGAWLRNPLPDLLSSDNVVAITNRRLDQFSERFSFDRQRLKSWASAQTVLSAWWHIEDSGYGWEPSIQFAEIVLNLPD